MTQQETAQIMAVLELAYPSFYSRSGQAEKMAAVRMWHRLFSDEPYKLVEAAVLSLVKTRQSAYPPAPGEVTAKIQQLTSPNEMTELEAWGMVSKALRNSTYGAAEEFEKLPPEVRRVVRDPQQMREWALMEADEVQTVVASNFQRSFRAAVKQERDYQALPESVKNFLALNAGNVVKEIPQVATGKLGDAEIEAIQRVLREDAT